MFSQRPSGVFANKAITADTLTIYRLLDWIDHDVRAWAVTLSRLQPIIATQPN